MANQDMHRSKVPREPDLNLNLSLGIGSSGKFYPIPPLQNPPPPPSSISYVSAHRGTMTPNSAKEKADLIKELQATRRREVRMRLSSKKKAREAKKEVTVAVPPALALSVEAANLESVQNNSAFCRAMGIIRSTVSQASGKSDGVVARLAGKQVEQLPKLNQWTTVAPPQTMVVPNTGGNGKAQVMYTSQSDHRAKSPSKMPRLTTSGGIPNGKKIEGVLVKSQEPGHNLLIVCLCHGHYLSPEEFVQHAGGLDLSNCMRHIKVEP